MPVADRSKLTNTVASCAVNLMKIGVASRSMSVMVAAVNKIATIKTKYLDDPALSQLLVEVTTEDGLTGVGECWWGIPMLDRPGQV